MTLNFNKLFSFFSSFVVEVLNRDVNRVSVYQDFCGSSPKIRCVVSKAEHLPVVLQFFRDFSFIRFKNLADVIGVDTCKSSDRFRVIYQLLSTD